MYMLKMVLAGSILILLGFFSFQGVAGTPVAKYQFEGGSWNGTAGEVLDSLGNHHGQAIGSDTFPEVFNTYPAISGDPGTCRYALFDSEKNSGQVAVPPSSAKYSVYAITLKGGTIPMNTNEVFQLDKHIYLTNQSTIRPSRSTQFYYPDGTPVKMTRIMTARSTITYDDGSTSTGNTHVYLELSDGKIIVGADPRSDDPFYQPGKVITSISPGAINQNYSQWWWDQFQGLKEPIDGVGFLGSQLGIKLPYSSELNVDGSFSITAWVKNQGHNSTYPGLISSRSTLGGGQAGGFALHESFAPDSTNESYYFTTRDSAGTQYSLNGGTVTNDEWTHLAITFQANGAKDANGDYTGTKTLYVNGSVVKRASNHKYAPNPVGDVAIGAINVNNNLSDYFTGSIDEVEFHQGVLTQVEVQTIKNETHSCPVKAVAVAAYHFEDNIWNGSAGEVNDYIGNNHGVANSGAVIEKASVNAIANDPGTCDHANFNAPDEQFLSIPYSSELNVDGSFSITAWVKNQGHNSTYPGLISSRSTLGGGQAGGFALHESFAPDSTNESYYFTTRDSAGTQYSLNGGTVTNDEWTHLAITFQANGAKDANGDYTGTKILYVNGSVVKRASNQKYAPNPVGDVAIGAIKVNNNLSDYYTGRIDEVEFHQGVLTQVEVQTIKNKTHSCPFLQPLANIKFDELIYDNIAGEVKDSIGNFHGQALNAKTVSGKVCNAVDLTATSNTDYVTLDKEMLNNKKAFSISLWVKTSNKGAQGILSGKNPGTENEILLFFRTDISFQSSIDGRNKIIPVTSIADDKWHHLVWTNGENQTCFYIDKVLQKGCVAQTSNIHPISSLLLGQDQDARSIQTTDGFKGLIDELVIFDEVISQSEIDQIYDYQNAGKDLDGTPIVCPEVDQTPPVANLKFDEAIYVGVADEVKDSVGSYHGQALNAQPVAGKVCNAIDLSATGVDDYVVLDAEILNNRTNFTISMWTKTSKTAIQALLSGGQAGTSNDVDNIVMLYETRTTFSSVLQNTPQNIIITDIADDEWHHVVWTHGDNQTCVYINTQLQGCATQTTETLTITDLLLGQEQDSPGGGFQSEQAFDGLIDELVVFDKVIDRSKINKIYEYQSNGKDLDGTPIVCPKIIIPRAKAYYRFDEESYSDVADEIQDSEGGFHGQAKNAQPVPGKVCNALDLSATGISDYAVLDQRALHERTNFTISIWLKTSKNGQQALLSGASSSSVNSILVWFQNSTEFRAVLKAPKIVRPVTTISDDKWHHVVWTHGNNESCVYIDKVLQKSCFAQTTNALNITSLLLGQEQDSIGGGFEASQAFNGLLDELAIFDKVLDNREVAQIYEYQSNGQDIYGNYVFCGDGPVANYHFDECGYAGVGNEVIDQTGNYDGIASSSAGISSHGVVNRTLDLSASSATDWVKLPSEALNGLDDFTIAFWMNSTDSSKEQRIIQALGNSVTHEEIEFYTWSDSRQLSIRINNVRKTLGGTKSLTDGEWHHVALTRKAGHGCLYIDGEQAQCSLDFTEGALEVTDGAFVLGQEQDTYGGGFSEKQDYGGQLDELMIFGSELTEQVILSIYTNQRNGNNYDGSPRAEIQCLHHYEIVHDGSGLTCEPEAVEIKACSNSDCTILSADTITLDVNITSTSATSVVASPTFIGSEKVDVSHTTAEALTLSISDASIVASSDTRCSGFGTSCILTFENAGFRFLYDETSQTTIPYQVAGTVFPKALKLQAVKSNAGVCEGVFDGEVEVELAQKNITPTLADNAGLRFKVGSRLVSKYPTFKDVKLVFDEDSIATITEPRYLDAGKISLYAKYTSGDISLTGSSNEFWVKPSEFSLTATKAPGGENLNGSDASSTVLQAAGVDFTFSVAALNSLGDRVENYRQEDGNLQLKVQRRLPTVSDSFDGDFIYNTNKTQRSALEPVFINASLSSFIGANRGLSAFTQAKYAEVGIINVDVQDANYGKLNTLTDDNSNDEGLVSADDITIGRFTPAYFKQTVSNHGTLVARHGTNASTITNWAYTGQTTTDSAKAGIIEYRIEPEIAITAYRASDADGTEHVTKNYTAITNADDNSRAFMKLSATDVELVAPTHDHVQLGFGKAISTEGRTNIATDFVQLTAAMNTGALFVSETQTAAIPATETSAAIPAMTTVNHGILVYQLNKQDRFIYQRNHHSFINRFDAQIPFITSRISDSDGVTLKMSDNSTMAEPIIAGDATEKVISRGVNIRFGRMVLQNAYGPEMSKLRVPLSVEVYNGTNFSVHSDENFLVAGIGAKNANAQNRPLWDYNLVDLEVSASTIDEIQTVDTQAIADNLTSFEAGKNDNVFFAAPNKVGVLEWEYEVPAWLKFDWTNQGGDNNGPYDQNPRATLRYGVYRGNDRIISWNELGVQ